jgi:AcrR family transcriptional regulator
MAYRRTENVIRRQAERHDAIVAAAAKAASEGGMAAIQIAPVAARAGIAAGTVYRYLPSKTDLVGALVASAAEREIDAVRRAAQAAPGPLSALAAAIATFAIRSLSNRKLTWAMLAEPADAETDAMRLAYRQALAEEFDALLKAAIAGGHLPEIDAALAVPALIGALIEGLAGPLSPDVSGDPAKIREAAQAATLFILQGLGVVDARARGLVAQATMPAASGEGALRQ